MRSNFLMRVIRWSIFLSIFGTIFFRWKLNNDLSGFNGIDKWAISLDISLAHLVVTVPLIILSILVFLIIVSISIRIIDFFEELFSKKAIEKSDLGEAKSSKGSCLLSISIYAVPIVFAAYGVFRLAKLILVDTIDWQIFFFGFYDSSIGFSLPSKFRFTLILDNFQLFTQNVLSNSTLSKIFSGIGAMAIALSAFVAFFKAIDYLSEKMR